MKKAIRAFKRGEAKIKDFKVNCCNFIKFQQIGDKLKIFVYAIGCKSRFEEAFTCPLKRFALSFLTKKNCMVKMMNISKVSHYSTLLVTYVKVAVRF